MNVVRNCGWSDAAWGGACFLLLIDSTVDLNAAVAAAVLERDLDVVVGFTVVESARDAALLTPGKLCSEES